MVVGSMPSHTAFLSFFLFFSPSSSFFFLIFFFQAVTDSDMGLHCAELTEIFDVLFQICTGAMWIDLSPAPTGLMGDWETAAVLLYKP